MAGKFELKTGASGKYMFNLKAANGQVILTSQQYEGRGGAENGIESVKNNAGNDANYARKTSTSGDHYFVLTAANGQVIGTSQMYSSAPAMENGVESVKANAPDAATKDLTG